ncbi:MAG: type 1 glutamine amidotransferase [Microthrixaceae bacterium]
MPVLVVQHLEPEQPAHLRDALEDAELEVTVVRVDRGEALPESSDGLSGLVVLGGPMSARSDEGFPTRRAELALLVDALGREVPVLGICLGAQLLAAAAGASVLPGHGPEIGWAPIELVEGAANDPLFVGVAGAVDVLHWHGETFDLPDGATLLASTDAYANQAFRVGEVAWGLQFHLEVDAAAVERFVAAFPDDAAHAPGGEVGILNDTPAALDALRPARELVLTRFAALARERAARPR